MNSMLTEPFFSDQERTDAALFEIAAGVAAFYSVPSPDRSAANEDAAALIPVDDTRAVLAVADGVGGHRAGQGASHAAVRCIADALSGISSSEDLLRTAILDGVETSNRKMLEQGAGAGTTLAVTELAGTTLRSYHVGDSAVLVVGQRGRLKLQTIAHSPVGYALESGYINEKDALRHDERHLLSNMVGSADMRIEVGAPIELAARDTVLLATDGLWDNMPLEEVVDTIRSGSLAVATETLAQTCSRRMRSATGNQPSKPDDLTFVLFRLASNR